MHSKEIKLIITDFDGTLVDTFDANFKSYQQAFIKNGIELTEQCYRGNFGYRFEDLMKRMKIHDNVLTQRIKKDKGDLYPSFFNLLKVNEPLLNFIRSFRKNGGNTAIASTASRENLLNAVGFLRIEEFFDLIVTGEDVTCAKPHPEIYDTTMNHFGVKSHQTIIFEDSQIGIESATAAGVNYIKITRKFYGN